MSDEVVWHCIRHGHCSFMVKITTGIFCRNPYNVTGICNRSSCPLANSRYGTIRDHDGVFYLYMKTAERAHLPNKLWGRVKLPRNYEKAIEVIDKHLEFWPKLLVHKIKQRLTKMTQYRIRMRKLQLKVREKIVTVPRKTQHDSRKMTKAELAAHIDNCVQTELLERLTKGCYGDKICNYPMNDFSTILNHESDVREIDEKECELEEYVEADDIEMEMDDMEEFEGLPNSEDGDINEDDDLLHEAVAKKQKGSGSDLISKIGKRSLKVIITELEQDEDTHRRQRTLV